MHAGENPPNVPDGRGSRPQRRWGQTPVALALRPLKPHILPGAAPSCSNRHLVSNAHERSWIVLRTRSDSTNEIEILVLRHQLAVLRRLTHDHGCTGPIEPCSPPSPDCYPECRRRLGLLVTPATILAGTANSSPATGPPMPPDPVGCQNSATASDQRFQAAASYSLIKPPRIGRRRILPRIGSGTGASGRGGRSFSDRCGRCRL